LDLNIDMTMEPYRQLMLIVLWILLTYFIPYILQNLFIMVVRDILLDDKIFQYLGPKGKHCTAIERLKTNIHNLQLFFFPSIVNCILCIKQSMTALSRIFHWGNYCHIVFNSPQSFLICKTKNMGKLSQVHIVHSKELRCSDGVSPVFLYLIRNCFYKSQLKWTSLLN
jgi:hypothetical protein